MRGVLQSAPLAESDWVRGWRAEAEPGFERFLGNNRLPKFNPFAAAPLFAELDGLVCAALSSGDAAELGSYVGALLPTARGAELKGALLACVFHEVYLLHALEGGASANADPLRSWLGSLSGQPGWAEPELALLRFFCCTQAAAAARAPPFGLSPAAPLEDVLKLRVFAHVAAAALSAGADEPLRLLWTALAEPPSLRETFLPAMPDDMKVKHDTLTSLHSCPLPRAATCQQRSSG